MVSKIAEMFVDNWKKEDLNLCVTCWMVRGNSISWNLREQQNIVDVIIDYLKSPQFLPFPDYDLPFTVHCQIIQWTPAQKMTCRAGALRAMFRTWHSKGTFTNEVNPFLAISPRPFPLWSISFLVVLCETIGVNFGTPHPSPKCFTSFVNVR